jgi:hypothetical protein
MGPEIVDICGVQIDAPHLGRVQGSRARVDAL